MKYRVTIDNRGAQIHRKAPMFPFDTIEEAVRRITDINFDSIDDDCVREADSKYDFEDDKENEEWHKAYSDAWTKLEKSLADGVGYDDGNGHIYRIEEDTDEDE